MYPIVFMNISLKSFFGNKKPQLHDKLDTITVNSCVIGKLGLILFKLYILNLLFLNVINFCMMFNLWIFTMFNLWTNLMQIIIL
jgi:hypothetical protein